jgi:predicted aconitase with swiveling domain
MKKLGTAPAALINSETEAILATGCVISDIPLVDKFNMDPVENLESGILLRIIADEGIVETVE